MEERVTKEIYTIKADNHKNVFDSIIPLFDLDSALKIKRCFMTVLCRAP